MTRQHRMFREIKGGGRPLCLPQKLSATSAVAQLVALQYV
jgi:hypothetical protein